VIETERLLLRKPRPDDAPAFAEMLRDPDVMHFIGGVTDEPAEDVLERWRARWSANGVGPFVLVRREDERVLGRAGLVVWDTRIWRNSTLAEAGEHAQHELGWALLREHWGRGYATEGAMAVREWAQREARVADLISLIHRDNDSSRRVAERLRCVRRGRVTLESGTPCDVWVHPAERQPEGGQAPAR
jgi:RimJ/RimL family protein N-acetyltransferase